MKNISGIKNTKLYAQVKAEADIKFLAKTSAYKSAWIVREFKKRGGTYDELPNKNQGLLRWFKEKWVDINRPGQSCGRNSEKSNLNGKYPLCRPSVRVSKNTPKTIIELTKKQISEANKKKQKVKQHDRVSFKII